MIAVGKDEVGDVKFIPIVKEARVAVLALGIHPHIEALGHDHHTQRVADIHLHLRGHVVRGTDGIATHILHHLDLTDEGSLVDGGSQGTEIVMQTNTLDFSRNAVELETTFLRNADGAYAELLSQLVHQSAILHIFDVGGIEIRRLRGPRLRIQDRHRHVCLSVIVEI